MSKLRLAFLVQLLVEFVQYGGMAPIHKQVTLDIVELVATQLRKEIAASSKDTDLSDIPF